MAMQDLLVHLDDSAACNTRLEAAIRFAQDHQAHLTGLYVMRHVSYPLPSEVIEAQWAVDRAREATVQAIQRRAEDARVTFEAAMERAGL